MSFFSTFLPDIFGSTGGCFGESKRLNVGDVLGDIGGLYGLGSVWAGIGSSTGLLSDQGYRPRSWNVGLNAIQMVLVKTNIGGLFFDAVLGVNTEEQLTITSHPVQSGANISDHAYCEPTRITMEIKMSDAMASRLPGQFNSDYTKSVSAYRRLIELQRSKVPFAVLTRLGSYQNMLIENISVTDDADSMNGLICTVSMREVLVASVAVAKVSAREWTTGAGTNRGDVQPKERPKTVLGSLDPNGTTRRAS